MENQVLSAIGLGPTVPKKCEKYDGPLNNSPDSIKRKLKVKFIYDWF